MVDKPADSNPLTPLVAEYGFLEMPSVVEGQRTFIASGLAQRYADRKGKYVLILHRLKKEHFIIGVYEDLKEALQTRYVTNLVLNGGGKFSEAFIAMVHDINGPPIDDKYYDAKTDSVAEFEEEEDEDV